MKLLLVEDEADLRGTLAQAFREEGYAVDLAADGGEGWYKARSTDYDAVVLDVMLPVMDGWEVLRRLREVKNTPILMLTARDALRDRIHGLDLGCDDYVVKPFDLVEVFARLRALLRRSAGQANPVIRFGKVTIDTARRLVANEGRPVELTAREYSLLEFLALRRGKMVSRTELYDHLFSEDEDSFSNLLDVHVCNVRKKLGKELIQTRRGQGYILVED